tara:strand:+ start:566 stop:877 length:312 start_codon:yes stop_codon:yes gene_type:complete
MGDYIMWNYRMIKDLDGYGLYEVFYNDKGEISAHSKNPDIYGDSVKEIISSLEMMLCDAKKHQGSDKMDNILVLEKDEIEFKDLYDPEEKLESIDIEDLNLDK